MQELTVSPLRGTRGSALVFALVFGIAVSVAGFGALRLMSGGSDLHKRDIEVIRSYWAGEGALRVAVRYLSIVVPLPTAAISPFNPTGPIACNGYSPALTIRYLGNRTYTCSSSVYSARAGVRSNITCSRVSVSNMSRYTWFTKETGSEWEGMVVQGDYHTNGFFRILSTMTDEVHVTGKASTGSKATANFPDDRPDLPNPYRNGMQLYSDLSGTVYNGPPSGGWDGWLKKRLPDYSFAGQIETANVEPDSFTTGVTTISTAGADSMAFELKNDKVIVWKKSSGTWSNSQTINVNGQILKCDKPSYVGGTLDGRLTIVTTNGNDIVIGNDINYRNNNLAESNDVLALVSGKDVVIPGNVNNNKTGMKHAFTTGGGTVHGSLFMPFGAIWVEDKDGTFDGFYTGLYDLNIYGGVLLKQAYGTYEYISGVGFRGIKNKAIQDPRFLDNRAIAPGIPYAMVRDMERSDLAGGSLEYMSALSNGSWRNSVTGN